AGLRGESDIDRLLGSLGVGRSEGTLDRLMMRTVAADGEVVVFGLESASMVSDLEPGPGGEVMGGAVDYAGAGMTLPTGSAVTDLSIHMQLNNFSVEAMRSMNRVLERAAGPADSTALADRFREDLVRLFGQRPELVIDPVRLLVDGEAVEASL